MQAQLARCLTQRLLLILSGDIDDPLSFLLPQVALKVIDKRVVSSNKKLVLRVRREISNLKKLRHGSVVEIYEGTFTVHATLSVILHSATHNMLSK